MKSILEDSIQTYRLITYWLKIHIVSYLQEFTSRRIGFKKYYMERKTYFQEHLNYFHQTNDNGVNVYHI